MRDQVGCYRCLPGFPLDDQNRNGPANTRPNEVSDTGKITARRVTHFGTGPTARERRVNRIRVLACQTQEALTRFIFSLQLEGKTEEILAVVVGIDCHPSWALGLY